MPEQLTNQDAIEYLMYMKHDVHAKSHMDIALDAAIEALKQPTIDAGPVRKGRWIMLEPYGAHHTHRRKCSECGEIKSKELTNFCPNCGAKMDGGADDENI